MSDRTASRRTTGLDLSTTSSCVNESMFLSAIGSESAYLQGLRGAACRGWCVRRRIALTRDGGSDWLQQA